MSVKKQWAGVAQEMQTEEANTHAVFQSRQEVIQQAQNKQLVRFGERYWVTLCITQNY